LRHASGAGRTTRPKKRCADARGREAYQPSLPGSPLNGPTTSGVIQPP